MHWISPAGPVAHKSYLEALGAAGFDDVLRSFGEYLGLDSLVAYHLSFIPVSFCSEGFVHRDFKDTGEKTYNLLIPLVLANQTGPELDVLPRDEALRGRYRYQYDVATAVGDYALHATSAADYRSSHEMRLVASVYVAEVTTENARQIMKHYTQIYPPEDDEELLLGWSGEHWRRDDPSKTLPQILDSNHVLSA